RIALELEPYASAIYFTMNPLVPGILARRANRTDWSDTGTLSGDTHVLKRRWLLIDADPVRIGGVSSTDDEKARSKEVLRAVRAYLMAAGWPAPIMADSGNGYHALFPVDLPADDGGLVKRQLAALAERFDTADVKVDQTV